MNLLADERKLDIVVQLAKDLKLETKKRHGDSR